MLQKLVRNQQFPFWVLVISIAIVLTLPVLIQDGMFMDAMLYTSVSHNLSMGIGTFWFPQFSAHNMADLTSFHEQPPLVFGIQALFFRVLGDSLYVERFYTFLTMCITGILINALWREVYKTETVLKKTGWLPVLLWITIPVCFWSYSNNMHENTMSIFTLGAVLFIYKAMESQKLQLLTLTLGGLFIFLATFSKGIPGFFPATIPFLHWFFIRKSSFPKMMLQTLVISITPLLIYAVLLLIPESSESLSIYFLKRAVQRINEVPTVDSRFYILGRLFMELLPQILLVFIVLVVARLKKKNTRVSYQGRKSALFIAIGLCASAPLMLTLVQKGFYFVPALPFFAIGLSMLIAPLVSGYVSKINTTKLAYKIFLSFSVLLFVCVVGFSFMQKGKASRNGEMLHDVYLIGSIVPQKSTLRIPPEIWNQWDLQCYLIRYFCISVDTEKQCDYFLVEKSQSGIVPEGYKKTELGTLTYDIYKRE